MKNNRKKLNGLFSFLEENIYLCKYKMRTLLIVYRKLNEKNNI